MKRCVVAAALLVTVAMASVAQQHALVGATLIDGRGGEPITGGNLLLAGDRIACVGSATDCPIPDGARVTDLAGSFITPGLVDAHVHFSQTGWLDGRPDGLSAPDIYPYAITARAARDHPERWFRSYLCSGITAVFDVGGHPWTMSLPARAEDDPMAVHVRAAGPLVTHAVVPQLNLDGELYTFLPMSSEQEALHSVSRLLAMGASAVKVWYLAPDAAQRAQLDARLMVIGAAARHAGLELIAHATSLREAKVALRAGAVMLVHSVDDALVDQEFLQLMAENRAIYAPTLVVGRNWGRAMASVALDAPQPIDDPNSCVDPQLRRRIGDTASLRAYLPQRYRSAEAVYRRMERGGAEAWVMGENLRRVHAAGITVATATDAGNPLTLHGPSIHSEMEAMQQAGLTPMQVIVASTRNGALAMARAEDFGTLEAGRIADLLVLEEDPTRDVRAFRSLVEVMRAGVLHRQADLAYPR